jgi:cytochrome c
MKRATVLAVILMVALATMLAYAQEEKQPEKKMDPKAEMAASIERGKALFMDAKLGTSDQSCNTCHTKGGTMEAKLGDLTVRAFDAINTKYPMYWKMGGKVMTLDQVINFCIVNPLKGKALAWDDQRLADLAAYCASVKPMKHEEKKETKTE